MTRVADLLKRDSNIFDSLRLFAAVLVIFSHSYALVGVAEPVLQDVSFGALGVRIFFVLSGLLIAASWVSHPRVAAFVGKRALRVLPGLAAVIVATILLGALLTNLSIRQYFSSNETYQYLNGISIFGMQFDLPGVFVANIYPIIVNGSLWTLPYEVAAYILLVILGKTKLLKQKSTMLGLFIAGIVLYFVLERWAPGLVLFTLNAKLFVMLATFFLAGSLLYVFRNEVVLRIEVATAMLVLIALSVPTNSFDIVSFVALPYLVLYAGSLTKTGLQKIGKYGDFSYGMYIYAWPVQQTIVAVTHNNIGHYQLFATSALITLILSVASWHMVEKRMLRLKASFNTDKYPLTGDAW